MGCVYLRGLSKLCLISEKWTSEIYYDVISERSAVVSYEACVYCRKLKLIDNFKYRKSTTIRRGNCRDRNRRCVAVSAV